MFVVDALGFRTSCMWSATSTCGFFPCIISVLLCTNVGVSILFFCSAHYEGRIGRRFP